MKMKSKKRGAAHNDPKQFVLDSKILRIELKNVRNGFQVQHTKKREPNGKEMTILVKMRGGAGTGTGMCVEDDPKDELGEQFPEHKYTPAPGMKMAQ